MKAHHEATEMLTRTIRQRFRLTEVAEQLRITIRKVKGLIRDGELRAIDVSSRPGSLRPRLVIDAADLAEFEVRRATLPPTNGPAAATAKPAPRRSRQMAAGVPNYFA